MRKNLIIYIMCFLSFSLSSWAQRQEKQEAKKVIERFTNGTKFPYKITIDKKMGSLPSYETKVRNGKLSIKGNSGIAVCKGFYDYIKKHNYGINSWSGNRFSPQLPLKDEEKKEVSSPYNHHYYFNVVTYGYTMPYWDWNRWEKEIDYMALHGIDMPLALVANEAISARVWKRLGLTDKEISEYFVGPAHLPWMRMGNISGIDGPLPKEWHEDQIKLQHQILKRMKSLGMSPICPGFAGFVPEAMERLYPNVEIVETSWGGAFHNWMLSPEEDLFHEIGKLFIEEWEKEFGKNKYYIVDSFNEMEIPFPPKNDPKRYKLLASYGDRVYQSIKAGNKDAVWVMQGWMFGYQRHIWDYKTLEALVSKVPDDKMLLLDLAVDYNSCRWHNKVNWEFYKGFYGKQWIYSVIPNMGGKSGLTGVLSFYANGHHKALNSKYRGNLVGYGMAPEGIDNNEVLYELVTDAGWKNDTISLNNWLKNYTLTRYGVWNKNFKAFWKGMTNSVYGSFTDHPRYNWQFRPGRVRKGSINCNNDFFEGIEHLSKTSSSLKNNQLFVDDYRDFAVAYLGGKVEILIQTIERLQNMGNFKEATKHIQLVKELMLGMDKLLVNHPTKDMQHWIDFARKKGRTNELSDYYEKNARRIVTIWGPPVDDYSARIWSGLIRDYYWPRWDYYFKQKESGIKFNFAEWERKWVEEHKGLSASSPSKDPVKLANQLIEKAKDIKLDEWINNKNIMGLWSIKAKESKNFQWDVPARKISKAKAINIINNKVQNGIILKEISVEMDGQVVFSKSYNVALSKGNNSYKIEIPDNVTGNNSSILKIKLTSTTSESSNGFVEIK